MVPSKIHRISDTKRHLYRQSLSCRLEPTANVSCPVDKSVDNLIIDKDAIILNDIFEGTHVIIWIWQIAGSVDLHSGLIAIHFQLTSRCRMDDSIVYIWNIWLGIQVYVILIIVLRSNKAKPIRYLVDAVVVIQSCSGHCGYHVDQKFWCSQIEWRSSNVLKVSCRYQFVIGFSDLVGVDMNGMFVQFGTSTILKR